MKRIAVFVFALFTILAGSSAKAQTSSPSPTATPAPEPSLGDYARKAQKAPTAKAKPKVFDNDNLPTEDKISVVGETSAEPAPADAAASPAAPADPSKATAPAENKDAAGTNPAAATSNGPAAPAADDPAKKQAEWKNWQQKLTAQKDSVDLASRELDVLQKEYQLCAATMYADVGNRLRNATQWDKEDADYKQKIADKQKAVDDAKQKLDDMEEEARRAGVPAAMREP